MYFRTCMYVAKWRSVRRSVPARSDRCVEGAAASYAAIQAVDTRLESLDDFSNASHFVELDL